MSVLHKKSARLRDEERARLIWLLSTDKAVTSALLGKLTLAERYDEGTLADDLAEVEVLVSHLPPPDLADALEALPYDARTALWGLVADDKRGEVLQQVNLFINIQRLQGKYQVVIAHLIDEIAPYAL
ncbi:hypothetical protein AWI37_20310 [Klebsiella aerogenes]|nr:hypothetical protein AWI37_20310 [Klebsiella aerogenes]